MQWIDVPSAGESASVFWERFLLIPLPVIIFGIILFVYNLNKSKKQESQAEYQYKEATNKICPDCLGNIPKLAKKCMHCGTKQPPLPVEKEKVITQPVEASGEEGKKFLVLFLIFIGTFSILILVTTIFNNI